jgi:cytochrome c553
MNRILIALSLSIGLACRPPERHEPAPVPPSRPVAVSDMMHGHFRAIRDIQRALIVDDLETAKARAREVARMPENTGSSEWDRSARFLRGQAERLASAPDPNQARSLATEMATFCADCHMMRAKPEVFRPAAPPPDDRSVRAAMARHAWGAETMWLGVIAPSTDIWREGMEELARSPRVAVDGQRAREVSILNARLAALASRSNGLGGQGDRARRLAEVLDVCAACHAITRR